MSPAVRRRRLALAGVAGLAALTGALLGSRSDDGEDPASTASSPAPPHCPAAVAADPRRLAGQMLVVRMEATATAGLRRAVRRGEIGGVVLFPPPGTPPDALGEQVETLGRVAIESGSPAPLVMIDQEGGEVKRLTDLPPNRSPAEIAARGTAAATTQGQAHRTRPGAARDQRRSGAGARRARDRGRVHRLARIRHRPRRGGGARHRPSARGSSRRASRRPRSTSPGSGSRPSTPISLRARSTRRELSWRRGWSRPRQRSRRASAS